MTKNHLIMVTVRRLGGDIRPPASGLKEQRGKRKEQRPDRNRFDKLFNELPRGRAAEVSESRPLTSASLSTSRCKSQETAQYKSLQEPRN